jgi:hypothetical protein
LPDFDHELVRFSTLAENFRRKTKPGATDLWLDRFSCRACLASTGAGRRGFSDGNFSGDGAGDQEL